ncbi:MFS transporter [Paenibacillus shenyangensis]|uniref:MFS transporter n=1 Tax=Paenibacillus sp. A9 TaxID=1284352 RepID=UPI000372B42A|nr:MFS transporter [Paenibacillus sp. A9]
MNKTQTIQQGTNESVINSSEPSAADIPTAGNAAESEPNVYSAAEARRLKQAVPVILLFFLFALVIDNSFKLVSVAIAQDLHLSMTTVSWQATLAGLIIGIGAVVYATLADTVSIKKLLVTGIVLICIGSVIGYVFRHSFPLVLLARVIQTAGLASAETLYVIYVTKYLPRSEQKLFLGLSTSSYSLSLVIGALAGGYISTYLNWSALFLVPLVSILLLPFILKFLPNEQSSRSRIDFAGLILIASIATAVMLYISDFNWLYLILFAAAAGLFLAYISRSKRAFIGIEFFRNRRFISILVIVFIMYSVQLGYIFLFPFLMQKVYGLELDKISLLLVPGYITAVIVGALSGGIAKKLSNRQAVSLALLLIAVSVALPGLLPFSSPIIYVLSMMIFAGSFALMYAPLLDSCVSSIPVEKAGTAIGFYNLMINVAASIGITYTAAMTEALPFRTVLVILGAVSLAALLLYTLLMGRTQKV